MGIKKIIKEYLEIINEIDWNQFHDVSKVCIDPIELVNDLNKEINRLETPEKDREKIGINQPIIPRTRINRNESGEIDVNDFIKLITQKPLKIFSTSNQKMVKSSGEKALVISTGLPAIKGIVYDENDGKFYYVNTCPGAGACKMGCYARKGSYVRCPATIVANSRRLNFLLNHPEEYEDMMINEIEGYFRTLNKQEKDINLIIRWNDAGDFFSDVYFNMAKNVTNYFVNNGYKLSSYAYTKVGKYIHLAGEDILMNFSQDAKKSEVEKVDLDSVKSSVKVPRELFKGLFIKKGENGYLKDEHGRTVFADDKYPLILKGVISKKYNVPIATLKYTNELPETEDEPLTYNLIVLPSDTDIGAQRRDVKTSYLLAH